MADLTKLVLHTAYPAFMNNNVYTGTFTISGTINEGTNTFTETVQLDAAPDLVDIMFEGAAGGISRPAGAYFKEGFFDVVGASITWTGFISAKISGSTVVITVVVPNQTASSDTVAGTDLNYRIVDYSTTTDIGFDTRLNYLKRGFTGTQTLTLPAAAGLETFEFDHDLGYVPFFSVGAQLGDANIIWSGNYVFAGTNPTGSGGAVTPPQLRYWCDDTTLTIKIANGFNGGDESGDRDVFWAIYLDYSS